MRIVADNTTEDIARQRVLGRVSNALRDLTANLLRVARGAGKPNLIVLQTIQFTRALADYRDVDPHGPSPDQFGHILRSWDEWPETEEGWSAPNRVQRRAEAKAVSGALQIVAARLLGQRLQESAGETELYDGVNAIDAWRAEEDRRWAATAAPERAPVKKRAKVKPKAKSAAKKPRTPPAS